ncbi:MAG TPA: hypothetical protein VMU81_14600 [Acetobacteraceae bacterium]|nr:hypothetical protein [Acetobacteraceae bacterium]
MRPAWVKRAIEQLIRQFCSLRGNEAWIGISSRHSFSVVAGQIIRGGLGRQGGHYEVLPDMPLDDGILWRPSSGRDDPELWLAPTKKRYRAAFERYAQRYLGAAGLTGADVQIDHVFPKKAGVLGGLSYVRMLAIPPESNMAAGRTLEREMVARNEDLGPRGKETRMATYFAIGKAAGFAAYEQLPDRDDSVGNRQLAAALMAHLRGYGLPADVLTALDRKLTEDTLGSIR